MTENEEQTEQNNEPSVRKAKTGAWWKSVNKDPLPSPESASPPPQTAKPKADIMIGEEEQPRSAEAAPLLSPAIATDVVPRETVETNLEANQDTAPGGSADEEEAPPKKRRRSRRPSKTSRPAPGFRFYPRGAWPRT